MLLQKLSLPPVTLLLSQPPTPIQTSCGLLLTGFLHTCLIPTVPLRIRAGGRLLLDVGPEHISCDGKHPLDMGQGPVILPTGQQCSTVLVIFLKLESCPRPWPCLYSFPCQCPGSIFMFLLVFLFKFILGVTVHVNKQKKIFRITHGKLMMDLIGLASGTLQNR
jgi:hypothetical protein